MSEGRAEQGRRVLDEALRLLDVLQATRPAGVSGNDDGHGGPECRWCPVCRGIAQLREANPEAVDRLTGAVVDLAAAVRDLVGGVVPESGAATTQWAGEAPEEPAGVERVEVEPIDVQRIDRAEPGQ